MRESEFIELLNLYLDHEITAADAARLEDELKANPARRRIYRDYCRMQKACAMLADEMQVQAPTANPALNADSVVSLPRHGIQWGRRASLWLAGSAAVAAAAVAVMFVGRSPESKAGAGSLAGAQVSAPPLAGEVAVNQGGRQQPPSAWRGLVSVADQPKANQQKITLVADSLMLSGSGRASLPMAPTLRNGEDELAWVRNFQMISMQERTRIDQLRFETQPAALQPEARQFGVRGAGETEVEMTAFRFRK